MVDDESKKYQECLQVFERYFPSFDRESGCIKKIKEDLESIKQIIDLEEKCQKANFAWIKHNDDETYVSGQYFDGDLDISFADTIGKYRELIKIMGDLRDELIKKLQKQKKHTQQKPENKPKPTPPKKPKSNAQQQTQTTQKEPKETLHCSRCDKIIPSQATY